ncbi:hypothetical protein A4X09_0g1658 [Tilletia walkeri]|uniref:Secreted protein n=1 Tax=Tilletia walkeri TaxID=117179 RepID=A0A8X7T7T7_9BASI|nr:hypothetical protein A4X09_0g1658 [Tilletia walkeri]
MCCSIGIVIIWCFAGLIPTIIASKIIDFGEVGVGASLFARTKHIYKDEYLACLTDPQVHATYIRKTTTTTMRF